MNWLSLLLIGLLITPQTASAQLVQCTGLDCDFCSIVDTIDYIIQWGVGILVFVAIFLFAIAGFKLLASGGNTSAADEAKRTLTNVVIGFILVLSAWLIVDTILKSLTNRGGLEGWALTSCGYVSKPTVSADPDRGAPTATALTPAGTLSEYAGARFDESIVDKVEYINREFGLTVTGGHRTPERNAEVNGSPTSYHLSGRAGDFVGTRSQMEAGKAWASANGAKEAFIHDAGSGHTCTSPGKIWL